MLITDWWSFNICFTMTQIHGNTTLIQLGTNAPLLLRNDVVLSSWITFPSSEYFASFANYRIFRVATWMEKKYILSWWKKWGTDDKDTIIIIQLVAQKKESIKTLPTYTKKETYNKKRNSTFFCFRNLSWKACWVWICDLAKSSWLIDCLILVCHEK